MKKFLLLFFAVGLALAAVTDQKYGTMDMQVGKHLNFRSALFEVHFDGPLNLTGQGLVHELSLDPLSQGDGEDMPAAMMLQAGTADLVCPCDECDGPDYPECDAAQCVYPSVPGQHGRNGAPDQLLPMPAVEHPAEFLFKTFAGEGTNPTRRPNVFVAIKILESFEGDHNGWVRYVPEALDLGECRMRFTDGAQSPVGAHLEQGGATLAGVQTGTFNPLNYGCDYDALATVIAGINAAVETLGTQEDKDALQQAEWSIASFKASETWIGCMEMAHQLVTVGEATRTIPGDRRCTEEWGSDEWNADPCCSPEAAQTQCCAPRPVSVTVETATGVNVDGVAQRCSDPGLATLVVKKLVDNVQASSQCKDKAKASGANTDMWDRLTDFVRTCEAEIYGDHSGRPTCEKDDDCWTRCDTQRGECVVPFDGDGAAGPLRECMVANMNEELFIHLGRKYGFSRESPPSAVEAAFRANLEDTTCIGPSGWQFGDRWENEVVANCSGLDNCHCWDGGDGETCQRHYMVEANLTACVDERTCNWDNSIDESACGNGPTSHFCGECHGPQCWERGQAARCSTWTKDNAECTAIGGVQGHHEGDCVFPSKATEAECLPLEYCFEVHDHDSLGINKGCGGTCVVPGYNQSQCAAASPGEDGIPDYVSELMWESGTVSGDGYCQASGVWGYEMCTSNGTGTGLQYVPWMNFQKGRFDTNESCTAGYCTVDDRLTPEQCEAQASCTEPCAKCRAGEWGFTACVTEDATEGACQAAGASWRSEAGVCVLDGAKTHGACSAAGGTFMDCESLSSTQCESCVADGSCPVNQDLMQCHLNKWDRCDTEQECAVAGMCEDWELENWHNPQCQTYPLPEACTGVCIVDYDYSSGYPQCDWNAGQQWSQLGCVDTNVLGEANCTAAGGAFKRRATDESECHAHGSRCFEKRFYGFTAKDQEECESCDGEMQTVYRWRPGRWIGGEVKPLTWKARAMETVNMVGSALNWTKLHEVIDDVGASMVGKAMRTEVRCEMASIAASMQALSCLCGSTSGSCDVSDVLWADVGDTEFFSGIDKTVEFPSVKVRVSASNIPNGTYSSTVVVREVADIKAKLTAEGAAPGGLQARSAEENPLECVLGEANSTVPVGQLVGTCSDIDVGELEVPSVCLSITESWDNSTYFVPDFAVSPSNGTYIVGNFTVSSDGSFICGDIVDSGIYCPIYRIEDYLNPPAPEEEPVTETDSGSNVGAILLIVFGGLFVLFIFAAVLAATGASLFMFRGRNPYRNRYRVRL